MSQDTARSPRVAIVTGAAQGLGEAIALRLADDGLDSARRIRLLPCLPCDVLGLADPCRPPLQPPEVLELVAGVKH